MSFLSGEEERGMDKDVLDLKLYTYANSVNALCPHSIRASSLYIQCSPTPSQGSTPSLTTLDQSSKKLVSGPRLSFCCSPNPCSTPHTPAPLFLQCPSLLSLLEPPPSLLEPAPSLLEPPLPTNCHPPLPPSPSSPELGLTGENGASPAGPSLWPLRSLSLLSSKKEAGLEISCSLLILGLLLSSRLDIWRRI